MPDTNRRLAKLKETKAIIGETLTVMAHIEKRRAELLKQHSETLGYIAQTQKEQTIKNKDIDERIEKLVSAIGALTTRLR